MKPTIRKGMPGAVPNVRKAKAIHEKKHAEVVAKVNKLAKRAKATRGH